MDGLLVAPARLRNLRERAELRAKEMAERIRCHENHYRKIERGTAQPSPALGYAINRVLSECHGHTITFDDYCDPAPSRRSRAA